MNEQAKLLLLFQLVPAILLGMTLWGAWVVDDAMRQATLIHGLEWVAFFFVAGIPFELWLLSIDADEQRAAKTKKRARKTRG